MTLDRMTAFEALWREESRFVEQRLLRVLGDPHDVQDLLQDLSVKVMMYVQARPEARVEAAFLRKCSRNLLIDHFRKNGRERGVLLLGAEDIAEGSLQCLNCVGQGLPQGLAEARQLLRRLRKKLLAIPKTGEDMGNASQKPKKRNKHLETFDALAQEYLVGGSGADRLGITKGAFRTRMHRLRKRVATMSL